jgi:putative membrane protein
MIVAAVSYPDPWRFVPNPEVYVLVAFLVGAYLYMVRSVGPHAVAPGEVVTRRNIVSFVAAMLVLFVASTWPVHQIGEDYLYSVHMVQHMMLSYFLPPLVWFATPEWLLRVLIGKGRTYSVVRFLSKPVIAAFGFNAMVMILHIPDMVNASTTNGPLHFSLHLFVVLSACLMWLPVVGPLPELQMGHGAKMIYLFLQSVVPTVPAAWLSFAEGAVYRHYGQQPVRVWGVSVTSDQQVAGVIMKVGGGFFLWGIVIYMFFRRFGVGDPDAANSYRRGGSIPTAEIVGIDEFPLTYDAVTEAFDRAEAPTEPTR